MGRAPRWLARCRWLLLVALAVFVPVPGLAAVDRIDVLRRGDVLQGRRFGAVEPYETHSSPAPTSPSIPRPRRISATATGSKTVVRTEGWTPRVPNHEAVEPTVKGVA